jgi:hypothetical protein
MIKMVAAKPVLVQGKELKNTLVMFIDSDPVELNLSEFDLLQLQNVVGAYGFFEG